MSVTISLAFVVPAVCETVPLAESVTVLLNVLAPVSVTSPPVDLSEAKPVTVASFTPTSPTPVTDALSFAVSSLIVTSLPPTTVTSFASTFVSVIAFAELIEMSSVVSSVTVTVVAPETLAVRLTSLSSLRVSVAAVMLAEPILFARLSVTSSASATVKLPAVITPVCETLLAPSLALTVKPLTILKSEKATSSVV